MAHVLTAELNQYAAETNTAFQLSPASEVELAAAACLLLLGLPLKLAALRVEGALLQADQPQHKARPELLHRVA